MSEFKLRDYQVEIGNKGVKVLNKLKILYLAMEVRTGKTLTSLHIANQYKAKHVLFLTKKRAIPSIKNDYNLLNPSYKITIINNESAHKVLDKDIDFVISDEHHRNGAFPKPNKVTKLIKQKWSKLPMIFLSGTPHPESYSQIFHQFWVSDNTPFEETTFYKWAKTYVTVKQRRLGYAVVNDYSSAKYKLIKPIIDKYLIAFTQKDAGFSSEVCETTLFVPMDATTYKMAKKLERDKILVSQDGKEIVADTAVKMMQKLHQIYSGTVLCEDGTAKLFDDTKAQFIKDHFKGKKLGIFYKFRAEWDMLKKVFGDSLTNTLDEFNGTDKHIALQIVSGSEGISLKEGDCIVYYNIDFSSKNYWQSRDRLTTMDRLNNDVYWIFSEGGIEEKIYRQVLKKKNYTSTVFKRQHQPGIVSRSNPRSRRTLR
jgi:hypothetical protein